MEIYNNNIKKRSFSLDDLPPPNTRRWVIRRKAQVVKAVQSGLISMEEACEMYSLSKEEFSSWQKAMKIHGSRGLRATRIQYYRTPKSISHITHAE
tara:strand:- start:490 stop:777 length:288 start_codon:yes stop_codon:yes gene_type:complete